MANVLSYINTGTLGATSGSFNPPASMWCRPNHKPTCCVAIHGANVCCVCVPTTATCYIIEMWAQGGGGGGGCCCGVGSYGGQGGSYGWVACTTSGVNHILCACACDCRCSTCTICSGTPGQFSRVYNCQGLGGISGQWCVCGGAQGYWCCNPDTPWCWNGAVRTNAPYPTGQSYNIWLHWKDRSAALAAASTVSAEGATGLTFCNASASQTGITPDANTFTNGIGATCSMPGAAGGTIWNTAFPTCSCTAFSSPYVWQGACGFSDPAIGSSPFGCYNTTPSIPNAACGGGMGTGGAAYAGGDQAWHKCGFNCYSCYVQCGNFPGGGGMSTWSQTAWANPGWGAPGLILISWC